MNNKRSVKEEIIQLINTMETEIGDDVIKKLFNDKADGKDKIGCGQFRELAANCKAAECYEEILMLVRYTTSKANPKSSWKTEYQNGKKFGKLVEVYMGKVKDISSENVLENLQLFFGYLYWQSRIWADNSQKA